MARPIKKGLSYFPLDTDFFRDKKIKTLKGRFGVDGITLYLYILCEIYRESGYYLKVDEDFVDIAADDLNFSPEKIGQIMNFFLERSLFDDTLFMADKVLTSHGIQMRFQEAVKKRRQFVDVDEQFWVLNENETQGFIRFANFEGLHGNNKGLHGKNPDKSPKKDTKKSKENEIKIKHIICAAIEYLNGAIGTNYKAETKQTITLITARVNEGYTLEDIKTVIDKKVKEWKGTDMERYLRPETLFGNKFEGYLNGKSGVKGSNAGKFNNYSCTTEYDFDAMEKNALIGKE